MARSGSSAVIFRRRLTATSQVTILVCRRRNEKKRQKCGGRLFLKDLWGFSACRLIFFAGLGFGRHQVFLKACAKVRLLDTSSTRGPISKPFWLLEATSVRTGLKLLQGEGAAASRTNPGRSMSHCWTRLGMDWIRYWMRCLWHDSLRAQVDLLKGLLKPEEKEV